MSPATNRIYVDLDDVLSETARAFIRLYREEWGRHVVFEEISAFDLTVSFGLSNEELEDFMRAAHRSEVLGEVTPVEGAREVLAGWKASGCTIEVATGRPPLTRDLSARWLARHRMPHDELLFVKKYARPFREADDVGAVTIEELEERDYQLAVEDSLETAVRLASDVGMQVCLLDRPWNRQVHPAEASLDGKIVRCADWNEISARYPVA